MSSKDPHLDATRCMKVRCPHCHEPIEILDDESLTEVTCSVCGSSFNLLSDTDTVSYDSKSGETIAHFELLNKLGTGAFGTVWKAKDTVLDRTIALKVPRQSQLPVDEREKFFREARAAAQLKHENIVSVFEVGRDGETVFIASEFIDGVTLSDWMTGNPISSVEAAEICEQVAIALHHAHQAGVIHRDVKPSNIVLDKDFKPYVMDFGLAKRDAGEITMTTEGVILGTPAYMSPEQAKGEAHGVDARSDVYSLGVVLFELLTNEKPFRGNARMLLHQVVHEEAPSPRRWNNTVPRDLETICLKCLEKDPAKRYQTAEELADDLSRFRERKPILARPVSSIEKTWRWCRRNPTVAGLSTAVFSILVVGVAVSSVLAVKALNEANRATKAEEAAGERGALLARTNDQLRETLSRERDATRKAQLSAYNVQMARIQDVLQSEPSSARKMLEDKTRCPEAVRDFTWNYLHRNLSDPDLATIGKHDSTITAISYSDDGKRIATSSHNSLKVWNAETHELLHSYSIPLTRRGQHLCAPRNGNYFYCTGEEIRAFDWNGQSAAQAIADPKGFPSYITISPNGQFIATCGNLTHLTVFDAKTGRARTGFSATDISEWIQKAVFSGDSKWLATIQGSGRVVLWNVESGNEIREIKGPAQSICFTPDNRYLAKTRQNKVEFIPLSDTVEAREPWWIGSSIQSNAILLQVWFSPNEEFIGVTKLPITFFGPEPRPQSPVVEIWHRSRNEKMARVEGHKFAASPSGRTFAIAHGHTIKHLKLDNPKSEVWNLDSDYAEYLMVNFTSSDANVLRMRGSFPPNKVNLEGDWVALGADPQASSGVPAYRLVDSSTAWSEDSEFRAKLSQAISPALQWSDQPKPRSNVNDRPELDEFPRSDGPTKHTGGDEKEAQSSGRPARSTASSEDTTHSDRDTKSIDEPNTPRIGRKQSIGTDTQDFQIVAASTKKRYVAVQVPIGRNNSGPYDFPLFDFLIWDNVESKVVSHSHQQNDAIIGGIFSHDEKLLATIGFRPDTAAISSDVLTKCTLTVQVWEVPSLAKRWNFSQQCDLSHIQYEAIPSPQIAISPDGKLLATPFVGKVNIWNITSGELHQELDGHNPGDCLCFSADGKTLAIGDRSGDIRLWDPVTGQLRFVLTSPTVRSIRTPINRRVHPVQVLYFSKDGNTLISQHVGRKVRLWHANQRQSRMPKLASFEKSTGSKIREPDYHEFSILLNAVRRQILEENKLPTDTKNRVGKAIQSWRFPVLQFASSPNFETFNEFGFTPMTQYEWDSDRSQKLRSSKVPVYNKNGDGKMSFFRIIGEGTVFAEEHAMLEELASSTRSPLILAQLNDSTAVHWLKPHDIAYNPKDPLKCLGEITESGILLGFMNGEMEYVERIIDPQLFKHLVERRIQTKKRALFDDDIKGSVDDRENRD